MDLTLEEEGAQVTAATSFDPTFPPSNIFDGHEMDDDGKLPPGSDRATSDDSVDLSGQDVERERQGSVGRSVQRTRADKMGKALRQQCVFTVHHALYESDAIGANVLLLLAAYAELSENDGNLQIESENVELGDASFIKFKILGVERFRDAEPRERRRLHVAAMK